MKRFELGDDLTLSPVQDADSIRLKRLHDKWSGDIITLSPDEARALCAALDKVRDGLEQIRVGPSTSLVTARIGLILEVGIREGLWLAPEGWNKEA